MRDVMYLGTKCYQKQTLLLEMELLSKLEQGARQQQLTLSEHINQLLKKEVSDRESHRSSRHPPVVLPDTRP